MAIATIKEQIRDKNEFIVHIMHGYDTLLSPDGKDCFGCYINEEYEAYVADDMPADQLFHTVAHEYMHYLQDIEGREFDEEEANNFGFSVFSPTYHQGWVDAINEFEKCLCQYLKVTDAVKYGNKTPEQRHNSYDTYMCYEIKDAIDDVADGLRELKE